MDRLACVDLGAFSLQLLKARNPGWASMPTAVVSRETPQGTILEICPKAAKLGVVCGMSCAAAMGLVPNLHMGVVSSGEMERGKKTMVELLRVFSPEVESIKGDSGSFWLNASGLERLCNSSNDWANEVLASLKANRFHASMVIGFTRFGTFALARALFFSTSKKSVFIVENFSDESKYARRVPLSHLGVSASNLKDLSKLGKKSVGDLLQMPATGLLERFGPELERLHNLATGELFDPLMPAPYIPIMTEGIILDDPEHDSVRLTFIIKRLLAPLLTTVASRHQALSELDIFLDLYRGDNRVENLKPAEPTLDEAQLIDLVRLRLESLSLPQGAQEIVLTAHGVRATAGQLELFAQRSRRDIEAASQAFARLRAEFGPDAVMRMKLTKGHLPEARFLLENFDGFSKEKSQQSFDESPNRTLVRRMYNKPIPLQSRPVCGPRGCHLTGMDEAPCSSLEGPFIVSGGWWKREVHREYYFAQTEQGKILWVFFDKYRRRWFLHGEVQ